MRKLLIACTGALALGGALAGTAFAQDITTDQLTAVDTNGDGAVDAAEIAAMIEQAFARLDANGDGYVTLAESSSVLTPEQFAAANTNGDDGLSLAELQAQATRDFAAADRNGDGTLN